MGTENWELETGHCGPNESFLLHGEAVVSKHLKIDKEAQTENNFGCIT